MFGLIGLGCKGLHCAGCGKGIPAGLALIILAIVAKLESGANALMHALANGLMYFGLVVGGCIVLTGTIISVMQRRDFQMVYGKWDGPTMVETKAHETWTQRAQLESPNPFYNESERETLWME